MSYFQNSASNELHTVHSLDMTLRKGSGKEGSKALQKDRAEFNKIYGMYMKSVYSFVLFKTNSYQDAEDITAEVFYRYLTKGGSIKQESILPWLYVVAGNLCISHFRDISKDRARDRRSQKPEVSNEEPWNNTEAWALVKNLNRKEQQVIYLRSIEDKSFQDIAEVMKMKVGAVKMTFYRAARQLRALLKEDTDV